MRGSGRTKYALLSADGVETLLRADDVPTLLLGDDVETLLPADDVITLILRRRGGRGAFLFLLLPTLAFGLSGEGLDRPE